MAQDSACPACGSPSMSVFFQAKQTPVQCCVLFRTKEEAKSYPRGDIELGFCRECGMIYNLAFDPDLVTYSPDYENSLHFSPVFQSYMEDLIRGLIDKYGLRGKDIIEIGCGKGDLLTMLCDAGGNRGVGFDPSYEAASSPASTTAQVTFIQDFYSERYASYKADFVCCRHTLEHVQYPAEFLTTVRRAIGGQPSEVIFFEVPNAMHTLRKTAIWEVFYEHVSYFSPGAFTRLFNASGFDVLDVTERFDGQFLCIEARAKNGEAASSPDDKSDLPEMAQEVASFADYYENKLNEWRNELERISRLGQRCVVWGGGARGVSFLNMLETQDQIEYVVDINPRKHGMYIAGTGQQIVSPEYLRAYRPDVVIVMNPIYKEEIRQQLAEVGVTASFLYA